MPPTSSAAPSSPIKPDSPRYRVVRTPGRYAVLLNARAKGWSGEVHQAVHRYISTKDLFLTENFHQARLTVDKLLASDYDAIFTGGGDGTVVYLINEIERRIRSGKLSRAEAPPIGVLRLGTGNALANYLGSGKILTDLRALSSGSPLTVHAVNMLEGHNELFPFAGVGWDADILNDYEFVKDLVRGSSVEPWATGLGGYAAAIATRTIPRVVTKAPVTLRLTNLGDADALRVNYDGDILESFPKGDVVYEGPAHICGAASIPYWGFKVRMFPHADAYPNMFQTRCFFGKVSDLLLNLRDFWQGKVREDLVFDVLASHLKVELLDSGPLPYQVSGDVWGLEREMEWKITDHPTQLAIPMY